MIFNQTALVLIGLLLAGWTLAAVWVIVWSLLRERRLAGDKREALRLARMLDESPALPLLVRVDGRIEAPGKLAGWLGLGAMPQFLSELDGGPSGGKESGLSTEQLAELTEAVRRTQKTAAPFRMVVTPKGSRRSLALRGHLADPQVSPGGAAMVWVFDFSDSESELIQLREQTARARSDFAALVALIEAAPLPMWFRGPDGALRLVNSAYVSAVGAASAEAAIGGGIELVEPAGGISASAMALSAAESGQPLERSVMATVAGARRMLRVSDLPLGAEGIAGYAIDIEDLEEQARALRAFREAQRSMLDQLSAGVAQFDARRRLSFVNQPFRRLFALESEDVAGEPPFALLLDAMRESGRLPEVRDFPAWRREKEAWFAAGQPCEEAWSLGDGTHFRILAQPLPDGGLLLIAEDRTEQLQVSANRDTLLRTRAATFDSLFESVAVFAPDGRMHLWNRRFARDWDLDDAFLDSHPHVETLLERIAPKLVRPQTARSVGDVVRAATLERRQSGGRAALADGRFLRFTGVPLPDGNGLLAVLDITDSQKAEAALKERNAALSEADAIKTRFLANMSYEFRTPLTSIGGFAELLEAGLGGALDEQGREYVAAILTSVARLGEQIESVLDLSQSEAGLLPLAREEIDAARLVKGIVADRGGASKQAGLRIELRGEAGAGKITGDPGRLARAIGHVLDNAIAASPQGGRILVEMSRGSEGLGLVISDGGRGMDSATLARAIEGLKTGPDGKTADRRQGIGLPLARQLIAAHGGTLELVSEPGQGTTATILLP
jgi:signal transduction histidine kinase